jgi:broad specificity phosphatase PhoE
MTNLVLVRHGKTIWHAHSEFRGESVRSSAKAVGIGVK